MILKQAILSIALTIFATFSLSAQWELVLDKDGIQVHNKPNSDGYSYYKATGTINTNINDLYDFFTDLSRYPEWVNNCKYAKVIQHKSEYHYIHFSEYDLPWPASDRYTASEVNIDRSDNKIDIVTKPYLGKVNEIDGAIRITRFNEHVVLTKLGDKKTRIDMSGAYDPSGSIPGWLTDKFMKYGPYDMIIKMREFTE